MLKHDLFDPNIAIMAPSTNNGSGLPWAAPKRSNPFADSESLFASFAPKSKPKPQNKPAKSKKSGQQKQRFINVGPFGQKIVTPPSSWQDRFDQVSHAKALTVALEVLPRRMHKESSGLPNVVVQSLASHNEQARQRFDQASHAAELRAALERLPQAHVGRKHPLKTWYYTGQSQLEHVSGEISPLSLDHEHVAYTAVAESK